ncbi:transcriptional repressor [Desulfobulbus alkaliphilus]|uniref:transcriptional repressor n=1 Tax=Desulfobulbus alkaliphilus TaxID=869814 RepID=UPI001963ADC5|nr:transcriptional repressor [Desulfobulbus alkaliphilus]MBM9536776.1 transcriptional repressor [Desulfobulbus alkaliphilus]
MTATLRMTHQREIILQELSRCGTHPTADDLYEHVRKQLPRISLATVYRNLEILSEAGLIKKLEVSGRRKRFDWDLAEHNHISCMKCQRVDNIDTTAAQVDTLSSGRHKGYTLTGLRIEFIGLCPTCRLHSEEHKEKGEQTMGCRKSTTSTLGDQQRQVLEALAQTATPCGSKDIAAATGLESKQISCQITALKKKGYVESPARCRYEITEQGKQILSQ